MANLESVFFRMMDNAVPVDAAELAALLKLEIQQWRGLMILPHHRKAADEFAAKLDRYIV